MTNEQFIYSLYEEVKRQANLASDNKFADFINGQMLSYHLNGGIEKAFDEVCRIILDHIRANGLPDPQDPLEGYEEWKERRTNVR